MKRTLVSYSSSEDSESESAPLPPPPSKKKKLPTLASSLLPPSPLDNPALHQGRTRTSPHIEGQFAAYVYIPVSIDAKSALGKLVRQVVTDARQAVSGLHSIGISDDGKGDIELHISLSRPTFLRAHQREDLKRAVKTLAKNHAPFKASFSTFSTLTNDDKTREFITLEVGAGHNELRSLTEALSPTLYAIRQKEFYTDPKFHASIAWALFDPECASSLSSRPRSPADNSERKLFKQSHQSLSSESASSSLQNGTALSANTPVLPGTLPTFSQFPASLIPSLISKHGFELTRTSVAAFEVTEVKVKIGKCISGWILEVPN